MSTTHHHQNRDGQPVAAEPFAATVVAGRYRLGREIARGGMGAVFRVHDDNLDRDLALKVMLADPAREPVVASRFIEEAKLTAGLEHAGIVPVHEVGTLPDGRPFFAMKLVRGRTLAEILASQEREGPETVGVFERVCQAVGFAHSRGVIHRDIKPLNVMVGDFGEVQVMDWGLAKEVRRAEADQQGGVTIPSSTATIPGGQFEHAADPDSTSDHRSADTDDRTRIGTAMGTPAYMPPEQARGEWDRVTERADVFALGAVLCHILTGKPPFDGGRADAIVRRAAAGDLAGAFERLDRCDADAELVALCRRCLSADPDERPADGGEVAALVAAYRAGVESRLRAAETERAEAAVRAVEERKRRGVRRALFGALTLLVVGILGFAWYRQSAAAERRLDQERADGVLRAEQERLTGEKRLDEERVKLERQGRDGRNADGVALLLTRCTEALEKEDANKAALAFDAAAGLMREGGAERHRGPFERCGKDLALLRALDHIEKLRWLPKRQQAITDARLREEWEKAFADWGISLDETPTEEFVRRMKETPLRDRILTALDTWLVRGGPKSLVAHLHAIDPDPFRDAVRETNAIRHFERQKELAKRPAALDQPARFAIVLGGMNELPAERRAAILNSAIQRRPDDFWLFMTRGLLIPINNNNPATAAEREIWYRAAVAVRPDNGNAHNQLAMALHDRGDVSGAIAEYRHAIRLNPDDSVAYGNLGLALKSQGDLDGAIAEFRKAIERDPTDNVFHNSLGNALQAKGDHVNAAAEFRESIRLNPTSIPGHNGLGNALHDLGQFDDAIAAYRKAIDLDPTFVHAHNGLGNSLREKRDFIRSIAAYREAIRLDPNYAHAHNGLGNALEDKGDVNDAIAEYRTAIRLDPKLALAHNNLGAAYRSKGNTDGAIAELRIAIKLDPNYADAHYNLGLALTDAGERDEAIASYREAVRLAPMDAQFRNNLGIALAEKGDFEAAVAELREAVRLNPKDNSFKQNLDLALKSKLARGANALPIAPLPRLVKLLDPKGAKEHFKQGVSLSDKGNLDGAIAEYRESIALNPKDANVHSYLGVALANKGDLDGATSTAIWALPWRTKVISMGPSRNSKRRSGLNRRTRPTRAIWERPLPGTGIWTGPSRRTGKPSGSTRSSGLPGSTSGTRSN